MPLETFFCCSSICFVMYKVGLVSVRFDVIDERTARAKSIACYARVQRSLFENGTRAFIFLKLGSFRWKSYARVVSSVFAKYVCLYFSLMIYLGTNCSYASKPGHLFRTAYVSTSMWLFS